MTKVEIRGPEQITTGWINDLLCGNGFAGQVEAFEIVPLGSGQLAESRRISLSYVGGNGQSGPASIVGAALLTGCFLAGTSYGYRWIFALWLAPLLWRLPPPNWKPHAPRSST